MVEYKNIKQIPELDLENVQEYSRILKEGLGREAEPKLYMDTKVKSTRDRKKLKETFKKFKGYKNYEQFQKVIDRVGLYDYGEVMVVVFWYVYFLHQDGISTDEDLNKGYKEVVDYIITKIGKTKYYTLDNLDELLQIEQEGNLKYKKLKMVMTDSERGEGLKTLNFELVGDGDYEITYTELLRIPEEEREGRFTFYGEKHLYEFLDVVYQISQNHPEVLLVLIHGFKILKKEVNGGYNEDKEVTIKQIEEVIKKIRQSLMTPKNSEWKELLEKDRRILGWWD